MSKNRRYSNTATALGHCFLTLFLAACPRKSPPPLAPKVIPAPATQLSRAQAFADPEGYSLRLDEGGQATIEASTDAGRFYGAQTQAQLAGMKGPLEINDAPRYRWRALHFDVARTFFPATDIERLLDLMAMLKLNVFHWHLTDDQGWRLPVKGHPELVTPPGYSRGDIARVVAHAKSRHITVVPEIDMPGHMRALLASHPELSCRGKPLELPTAPGIYEDVLCAGNPDTYSLIDAVLEDVAAQFPGPWLHLGGDEVPTARWDECPKCRALGLNPQTHFLAHVAAKVRSLGKRPVGWDEVLDHQAPSDLVVMAWRREAKVSPEHDTVLVPYDVMYLDRSQNPYEDALVTWEKIAAYAPPDHPRALGVEAALWTEYVPDLRRAEVALFPRLLAVADVAWSSPAARASNPFADRLGRGLDLLDSRHVSWFLGPPLGLEPRRAFIDGGSVVLGGTPGVIHYTLDGSEPTRDSPRYEGPIAIDRSVEIVARSFLGDRASPLARGRVFIEPPLPAVAADAGSPGVRYSYFEARFDLLPDFDTLVPTRSGVSSTLVPADVRAKEWALFAEGWFLAPAAGVFAFTLTSDDGSRLLVDGRTVIENDGLHVARARRGEVALAAGSHLFRIEFFQRGGGYRLELQPFTLQR